MSNKISLSKDEYKAYQCFSEHIMSGNDYINYGKDNKFPNYLWDLYLESSIHQAIIDSTVDYIFGEGVNLEKEDVKTVKKALFDFVLFGGFAIQVVYNLIGEKAKIKYLDFNKCRTNKEGNKVYYAKEWGTYRTESVEFDIYDPEAEKLTTQILYYKGNKTKSVYPIPRYIASLRAIETSVEIQNYHLRGIQNNFNPSAVVKLSGDPTEEEKKQIEDGLNAKFSGTNNTNRLACIWNTDPSAEIKIDRLNTTNSDQKFMALSKDTKENILIGHRATSPALFGMLPESGGFNKTEYMESFAIYNKTVIQPLQDEFEDVLSLVYDKSIEFLPYKIPFDDTATK